MQITTNKSWNLKNISNVQCYTVSIKIFHATKIHSKWALNRFTRRINCELTALLVAGIEIIRTRYTSIYLSNMYSVLFAAAVAPNHALFMLLYISFCCVCICNLSHSRGALPLRTCDAKKVCIRVLCIHQRINKSTWKSNANPTLSHTKRYLSHSSSERRIWLSLISTMKYKTNRYERTRHLNNVWCEQRHMESESGKETNVFVFRVRRAFMVNTVEHTVCTLDNAMPQHKHIHSVRFQPLHSEYCLRAKAFMKISYRLLKYFTH